MNSDDPTAKDSWEAHQRSVNYGKFFWHIGLPRKNDAKILLWSTRAEIGSGGSLLLYDPEGSVNLALAPGEWRYIYAASVFDGHPVAVEYWPQKNNRETISTKRRRN
jgi:hypothetical protein